MVDELIATWQATGDAAVPETKVVGHHWSQPSYAVRDFLARSSVPYRWYAADEPAGQRLLTAAGASEADVPVVIAPDGTVLLLAGDRRARRDDRADHDARRRLLRPGHRRRRPGRAGGRGLRRVRGAAHRPGRPDGDGRPGRPEQPDRELPGLPGRRLRWPAHRPGQPAGGQVRGRGAHAPARSSAIEARGPSRVVRFADGGEIAGPRRRPGQRRRLPGPAGRRRRGPGRPRRLLRLSGHRGSGLRRPARGRRRRRQLGRPGRDVLRPARLEGHPGRARPGPRAVHVAVPDRPGPGPAQHRGARPAPGSRPAPATDHLELLTLVDDATGNREDVKASHLFIFIGAQPQTAWLPGRRDEGPGRVRDDRTRPGGGRRAARGAGRWTASPTCSSRACPACSSAGDVRSQSVKRVASAVGEGALAVTLVHRYLEGR